MSKYLLAPMVPVPLWFFIGVSLSFAPCDASRSFLWIWVFVSLNVSLAAEHDGALYLSENMPMDIRAETGSRGAQWRGSECERCNLESSLVGRANMAQAVYYTDIIPPMRPTIPRREHHDPERTTVLKLDRVSLSILIQTSCFSA